MRLNSISLLIVGLSLLYTTSYAQQTRSPIEHYLIQNQTELELSSSEIENWLIYDQHSDKSLGLTYTYIQQTHEQIPVYNAIANFVSKDGVVYLTGNNLIKNIAENSNSVTPALSHQDAINAAAFHMDLKQPDEIKFIKKNEKMVAEYRAADLSVENIPVTLMLFPVNQNEIRLVWDLSIRVLDGNDWWSLKIDALNGDLLDKVNWTLYCDFRSEDHKVHNDQCISSRKPIMQLMASAPAPPPGTDQYNVFAIPTESPNHGPRTLVIGPYNSTASPYGWHDDNGSAGAEYTYTRGNNVRATEDVNDNNGVGFMPDGGATLDFDFPLNLNQAASGYQDVAITNLFYMNNIMHDVWYHYGFDEASGNFQQNNYGNGGAGSDYVNADAQDGGGTNNANFSTPNDGNNPRMQMYLWSPGIQNLLTVNSPSNIAGIYSATEAGFGSGVPVTPITSDLVLFDDNSGVDPNDACESAVNAAAMNGKIVVIRRGDCEFGFKVLAAENAGATAVIMINNVAGGPITMGAGAVGGSVTIPSVMISEVDGALLMAEMSTGTVNATLQNPGTAFDLDGDFDNGIIAHEYGHGISTRLTGGASNSNCLSNDEQMGEGWSDWFGLMLTIEPGDTDTDIRGIGTYASGEAPTGYGIRPAPYTTDLAVNNYTYDNTNAGVSQPHGIGFVWCTMLWDMTWALIDEYGFDPDVSFGVGGNNIAMHLVVNGLKIQGCSPGFEDGRDAILQADQLLYGGANECLIWNAFAARGLGFSADQGSTNSRTDQTEAFDLPPGFVNSSGSASLTECTSYTWAANGQTYTNSGSYTAILSNAFGCDSVATLNLTIDAPTTSTETASACISYTWALNSNTYSSSGLYTTTLVNAAGCDSIITLDLTINTDISSTQNISACSAYTWPADGNTYNTTGTYTALLTSAAGCDSLVTLNLTMSTSAQSNETVASCVSYLWPPTATTYTSSGTYSTTLTSSTGCDSIVTLFLTINSPTSGSSTVVVCDSYTWTSGNGNTYTNSGSYSTTLVNSQGCDSTATLNLTILANSSGPTETVTSCGIYTWAADGNIYNSSGIYTASLVNAAGCDSIVTLDLTIAANNSGSATITACNAYFWTGTNQTYTTSGTYTATLTNSSGCDSVATLDLTISSINASINYLDVVTLTAGQSGATYQWLDCNNNYSPIAGQTNQTFVAVSNGAYAVEVTMNGCVDTSGCRTISSVGIIENDFTALDVFPNPTFGKITVYLGEHSDLIKASLFSLTGQLIEKREFLHSDSFEFLIEGAPAYYILEIETLEEKKAKIKILKE